MRSAESARFQSEHRAKINTFIDEISQRIEEAIYNGEFNCAYVIPSDTGQKIRDGIELKLKQNGYVVNIPEKGNYYADALEISW